MYIYISFRIIRKVFEQRRFKCKGGGGGGLCDVFLSLKVRVGIYILPVNADFNIILINKITVIDLLISKTLILHFIISYCYHALLSILDRSPDVKVIKENCGVRFYVASI